MESLKTYRTIWQQYGPSSANCSLEISAQDSDVSVCVILLMEAGMVSSLDLISARFLYGLVELNQAEKTDDNLQLFLVLLFASLGAGSVKFGSKNEKGDIDIYNDAHRLMDMGYSLLSSASSDSSQGLLLSYIDARFPDGFKTIISHVVAAFIEDKPLNNYSSLLELSDNVDDGVSTGRPIILDNSIDAAGFYFRKFHGCEAAIEEFLKMRCRQQTDDFDEKKVAESLEDVINTSPLTFSADSREPWKMELNTRQQVSLAMAARNPFTVITGGPGTGKTTIVVNLIRILRRLHGIGVGDVRLAAPTGRAAARLQESVQAGLASIQGDPEKDINLKNDLQFMDLRGQTLHSLLKYQSYKSAFTLNYYNKVPARLIIIDEVSMVDIVMFRRLMEAMDDNTHIVLLGDRNQLPSVEAGAVLGELASVFYDDMGECNSLSVTSLNYLKRVLPECNGIGDLKPFEGKHTFLDRLVVLTESRRSVREIREVSDAVNSGNPDNVNLQSPIVLPVVRVDEKPGKSVWSEVESGAEVGCRFVKTDGMSGRDGLESVLRAWATEFYLTVNERSGKLDYRGILDEIFTLNNDEPAVFSRIIKPNIDGNTELNPLYVLLKNAFSFLALARCLALVKKGIFGTEGINKYLQDYLYKKLEPVRNTGSRPFAGLFSGLPIMISHNNYKLRLFNGDVGVVVKLGSGYKVFFERYGRFECFDYGNLPPHQPAFAMTVHKSQGSEFDNLLLILPEARNQLMTREILYTGITRARKFVGIYGTTEILNECIKGEVNRKSGLGERLIK
ncbi:MAG: exodeoxyribonuclease V subunit alpha [Planctomycetes bacterium]|nr:exodeoxyribonuclease V subunit alpha [Planctomycetota bacterium]